MNDYNGLEQQVTVTNQELPQISASPGWTTFFGVLIMIGGVASCLTIIGAIIGVPMIFLSLRFLKAAEHAKNFKSSHNADDAVKSMNEYLSGFKIYGILFIVAMSVYVVLIILIIIGAMLFSMNLNY